MDYLIDGMFLGTIIGMIIGLLIGLGISVGINKDNYRYTQDKLTTTQETLNEVEVERDIYIKLILEKSLEE